MAYRAAKYRYGKTAPDGWVPKLFERVWLPPRSPFMNVSQGTVVMLLANDVVKIEWTSNRHKQTDQILVKELRPIK